MDVKDHICTAGQEPGSEARHQDLQALLPAGKHHAREYDIRRDCRREHRTLPLVSSCTTCEETIVLVRCCSLLLGCVCVHKRVCAYVLCMCV